MLFIKIQTTIREADGDQTILQHATSIVKAHIVLHVLVGELFPDLLVDHIGVFLRKNLRNLMKTAASGGVRTKIISLHQKFSFLKFEKAG